MGVLAPVFFIKYILLTTRTIISWFSIMGNLHHILEILIRLGQPRGYQADHTNSTMKIWKCPTSKFIIENCFKLLFIQFCSIVIDLCFIFNNNISHICTDELDFGSLPKMSGFLQNNVWDPKSQDLDIWNSATGCLNGNLDFERCFKDFSNVLKN